MAANKVLIYRGDTFQGTINLRKVDPINTTTENPYPVNILDTIEVHFPGEAGTVILSTANVGEITFIDADLSTIGYNGSPSKSELLKVGANQTLTLIHTDQTGKVQTFQKARALTIEDRANP